MQDRSDGEPCHADPDDGDARNHKHHGEAFTCRLDRSHAVSKENTGVPRPVSKQGKSKVRRIKIAGPVCVVGKTTALASPETGFRRGIASDLALACQSFDVLRHHRVLHDE